MGSRNFLVNHILLNIICVQQKKENHSGLQQIMTEFSFLVELSL